MIPVFMPQVDILLNSSGLTARELLAKALSKAAVSENIIFLLYLYVCFFR